MDDRVEVMEDNFDWVVYLDGEEVARYSYGEFAWADLLAKNFGDKLRESIEEEQIIKLTKQAYKGLMRLV